jgi:hypothetical protein
MANAIPIASATISVMKIFDFRLPGKAPDAVLAAPSFEPGDDQ